MMKYFEWLCSSLVSTDWQSMNYVLESDKYINIPLSILVTLHAAIIVIIINILINWVWYRNRYRVGYEDGYTDGVISKAVKLGKLKFGDAPSGIVIYETSKEEFSNEIETSFKERKEKNKNT